MLTLSQKYKRPDCITTRNILSVGYLILCFFSYARKEIIWNTFFQHMLASFFFYCNSNISNFTPQLTFDWIHFLKSEFMFTCSVKLDLLHFLNKPLVATLFCARGTKLFCWKTRIYLITINFCFLPNICYQCYAKTVISFDISANCLQ